MDYSFGQQEAEAAYKDWGCNCGPAALAFALQVKLDAVRNSIPGFDKKRYTSPTMMAAALANLGRAVEIVPAKDVAPRGPVAVLFHKRPALVRVQWCGPWTMDGANPKWAYRQTHWIACWLDTQGPHAHLVFDVNGGIRSFEDWQAEIVPALTSLYKRANGEWFPTHIWRLV